MDGPRPELADTSWWSRLWQPFWALPALIALVSLALGSALPSWEAGWGDPVPWIFPGGVDGARSVLSAIASAMISVTGVVFSITIVVLQLASSQFTPRILGTFLQSRITQVTLGVFTGSFLYALTVLRGVEDGSENVPGTAVALAYLYVVVAVGLFLAFIHHITTSVQVSQVMTRVRRESIAVIRACHPEQPPPTRTWTGDDGPRVPICVQGRSGYVVRIDSTGLVAAAQDLDVRLDLEITPGDFVVAGQRIGWCRGRADVTQEDLAPLSQALVRARERDLVCDPGFGVRQLIDIAERALSPGVNDPTTSIQAINELHVILREMVLRADPSPYLVDEDGRAWVRYRPAGFADQVRVTVVDLAHAGADAVRPIPHLERVLDELAESARPEHREAIEAARAELTARSSG